MPLVVERVAHAAGQWQAEGIEIVEFRESAGRVGEDTDAAGGVSGGEARAPAFRSEAALGDEGGAVDGDGHRQELSGSVRNQFLEHLRVASGLRSSTTLSTRAERSPTVEVWATRWPLPSH